MRFDATGRWEKPLYVLHPMPKRKKGETEKKYYWDPFHVTRHSEKRPL